MYFWQKGKVVNRTGMNQGWLYSLKQKCDIVDVISRYIQVQRKGRNFWACCPFHHEKTPSFSINAEEGFFHCFGCKESGDVITFVQKYENCSFYEACEILAKSVGMEMPEVENNAQILQQKKQIDIAKNVLEDSAEFYQKQIYLPTAKVAQEYLVARKINRPSFENFRIGYSPDWTSLVNFLRQKGYTDDQMIFAGVAEKGDSGRLYDCLGKRLVFPIVNASNQVIGFSARALEKTNYAKYKNTKQTPLFNKSKAIFAIDKVKAKKHQGTLQNIVLVEGQIDVITMHQYGFDQTVATLGTALTYEHVPELKRYTDKIIVCFDGDEAGEKATLRSLDILKDFQVKIVTLPNNADPDEFLKSFGAEQMKKLFESADDPYEYKIKYLAKQKNLQNNDERNRFVLEALKVLDGLDAKSQKYVYLPLISKLSDVPVSVLNRDIDQPQVFEVQKMPVADKITFDDASEKAFKFVFASLLLKKDYATLCFPKYILANPVLEDLYDLLSKSKNDEQPIKISSLYDLYDVDNTPLLKDIINYNFDIIGNNAKQYYNDCVWTFCEYYLKEKQRILNEQFKVCRDNDQRTEILKQLQKISAQLKNKNLEENQ